MAEPTDTIAKGSDSLGRYLQMLSLPGIVSVGSGTNILESDYSFYQPMEVLKFRGVLKSE